MHLGSVESGGLFGRFLSREREARGMSRQVLADQVRAAATLDGESCGCTEKQIRRLEQGQKPGSSYVRWIAMAFNMSEGELAMWLNDDSGGWISEPVTPDYVERVRATDRLLRSLEVLHGGTDVAPLADRYMGEVRRRLDQPTAPSLHAELMVSAGRLAGTAAWISHDANHQDAARQYSYEALYLSRAAGDEQAVIMAQSNLSLFNLMANRPQEALTIARPMLATAPLTNYQRVIFELRQSRALALLGDESGAVRFLDSAVNAFSDGPMDSDWWWLNEDEVRLHAAVIYTDLGRYDISVPILQQLADQPVPMLDGQYPWQGLNYLRATRLLAAAVAAEDWATAEDAVGRILGLIGETHCARIDTLLGQVRLDGPSVPATLQTAGEQLGKQVGRR